ncbi:4015_t:CDS:2, partial [Funneliformis geosporum]
QELQERSMGNAKKLKLDITIPSQEMASLTTTPTYSYDNVIGILQRLYWKK